MASSSPHTSEKREGYLEWDDYLMGIALLASRRSKDPNAQVGACLASEDNKVIGVGYNGMPTGIPDDEEHWNWDSDKRQSPCLCHAAINAVLHSCTVNLKGCQLFVTLYPCCECTKYLIQTGIKEVLYYSDDTDESTGKKKTAEESMEMKASKNMFSILNKKKEEAKRRKEEKTKNKGGKQEGEDKKETTASSEMQKADQRKEKRKRQKEKKKEEEEFMTIEKLEPETSSADIFKDIEPVFPSGGPPGSKTPRKDALPWIDYFMGIAFLAGQRSKDKVYQVGACIRRKDKKIVGVGWNGMPKNLHDDKMPWGKGEGLDNKLLYVCHAEVNAVLHSVTADLEGCTIYTTLIPCDVCAKYLVQKRVKKVVFFSDSKAGKDGYKAAPVMFKEAKIKLRQYRPTHPILRKVRRIYEKLEEADRAKQAGEVPA